MNYIKQINAFYRQLQTTSLSISSISLWHALMNVNSSCGWKKEFSAAVSTLRERSSLSERTISKSRKELKEKGFINFKSRKGNQSAVYQMIDLSANIAGKNCVQALNADNRADKCADNRAAYLKEKKIKDSSIDLLHSDALEFFQNNYSTTNFYDADGIVQWEQDTSTELVKAAISLAKSKNGQYGLINKILNDWSAAGVKTVEDARKFERSHFKKKKIYQDLDMDILKRRLEEARSGDRGRNDSNHTADKRRVSK